MPSPKAECARCKDENACGVRMAVKEVRDATAKVLDGTSLAEVVRRLKLEKAAAEAVQTYSI